MLVYFFSNHQPIIKNKLMTHKEQLKEVAMISAIMADHTTEELYKHMQDNGHGYVATFDQISEWAIEFLHKHKKTNWEEVMEGNMKVLSNRMSSVICFDDACIDYAYYKLELLKKNG